MIENVIYVRASRAELRETLAKIPEAARARGAVADAMMTRCGLALLGRIRRAFIQKSHGGTDEAGERWKPLSPKTIAYSRRHPGVPNNHARAGARPSWALTDEQRRRWWAVYRQALARFKGNKASAAKLAWSVLKAEGAETLINKYGSMQVDILRDTGLLLNSLSLGVASGEQVFRIGRGEVIVGTNRKGAAAHHEGTARIPQRRLWPKPSKWPPSWWTDINEQARGGLVDLTLLMIRQL